MRIDVIRGFFNSFALISRISVYHWYVYYITGMYTIQLVCILYNWYVYYITGMYTCKRRLKKSVIDTINRHRYFPGPKPFSILIYSISFIKLICFKIFKLPFFSYTMIEFPTPTTIASYVQY